MVKAFVLNRVKSDLENCSSGLDQILRATALLAVSERNDK